MTIQSARFLKDIMDALSYSILFIRPATSNLAKYAEYSFFEPYFFYYVHVENSVDMWIKDRIYVA